MQKQRLLDITFYVSHGSDRVVQRGFYRAACNADAVLRGEFCPSVCPSVRPSVCLSHACIVTKRKKNLSRFLYRTKEYLS